MKTILHAFLLLLIASGILSSCDPDDDFEIVNGEYRLGAEGESYIKFEPGSYWVYQNDQTGERDSMTMKWYHSEMLHFKGHRNNFYREDIDLDMGHYTFDLQHPFVDATPSPMAHVFVFYVQGRQFSRSGIFFYPFDENLQGGNSGQITVLNQVHDSLQVQGQWYYDVAEFEVDRDYIYRTLQTDHTKYYWAKHVGLIKRSLLEEHSDLEVESWELIDYEVTQA